MSDSSATDDDKIITHLEWRSNNIIEKLNNSIKILNDDKNDDLQSLTIYVVSIEDDIHYILENIKNIGVKNKLIDTIASDDVPGKQFLNNMEIILNNYNVITLLEQLDIYIKKISQKNNITSQKDFFREHEIKILTDIIKSKEKIVSEIQEIYNDVKQSTSTVAPENGGGKRKSKRKYTKKQKKSRRARRTRK
jgi:hypothetical protein